MTPDSQDPGAAADDSFDDDALADALAAQVATYTSPIQVIPPSELPEPAAPAPVAAETVAPPAAPVAPPAAPVAPPAAPVAAEQSAPSMGPTTLDAIQQLEAELRRQGVDTGPVETPAAPEAPQYEAPAAPPAPPVYGAPQYEAPAAPPAPPVYGAPYQPPSMYGDPFAPAATPAPEPAAASEPAFESPASEPPAAPEPTFEMPADEPPAEPAPAFEIPAEPAPAYEPPAEPAPAFETPVDAAPAEPAVFEPAVFEPAVVQPVDAEPVDFEPVDFEPVDFEPVETYAPPPPNFFPPAPAPAPVEPSSYLPPEPTVPEYVVPEPDLPDYYAAPVIPDYVVPEPEIDAYSFAPQPEPEAPTYVEPEPETPSYAAAEPERPASVTPEYTQPEPVEPAPPAYGTPAFGAPAFEAPGFQSVRDEPAVEEPPAFEAPLFQAPVFEPPVFEAPAGDTPAYEQPASEQSAPEQPLFEQPAFEQPASEQPPFEQPAVDEPQQQAYEIPVHEQSQPEAPAYEIPVSEPTPAEPEAPIYEAPQFQAAPPQYDAAQYDAAPYDATPYDAAQYDATQYDATPYESPEAGEPAPASEIPEYVAPAEVAPAEPLAASDDWSTAAPPVLDPPPLVDPPVAGEPPVASAPSVRESLANLPPPVGMAPAPIPPYEPETIAAPRAADGPLIVPTSVVVPEQQPSLAPTSSDDYEAMLPPASPSPATPSPAPHPAMPEATEPADLDENDDAVDEIDRVAPGAYRADGLPAADAATAGGLAAAMSAPASTLVAAPPSTPVPTQRVTQNMPALVDEKPENHPAFVIETAGDEPTALDLRAGRAARMFWLWFAANSSVVSLALGAVLSTLGMSLRQAIVATLAGVALSFLPLGLGTLAGKWSGQPTMIVSRASFGHVGNILPALLALVTRVFWGGVLLWLFATSIARVLVTSGLDLGLGEELWTALGLLIGIALIAVVALFGYGFVARLQLIVSIVSGILVVGVIAITSPSLDIDAALSTGDGSWMLVVTGAVLVFSAVGLAWVHSSSDIARYQRPGSSGAASMLWATFGATLPPFLLIAWGAMLAASSPDLARGLASAPLVTLANLLPVWYPAPLLLAASLGLLSGAVLTVYSGGFALKAIGAKMPRYAATLVASTLVVVVAITFVLLAADAEDIVRDVTTTIAVPVAAWAGIFAAEMMIRTRRFHAPSLLARGGVYPNVRAVNLIVFIVLTALGFGLTSGQLAGFTWQGYLFPLFGVPADDPFAMSDIGVLIALVLALIITFATAIPTVRRQEQDGAVVGRTPTASAPVASAPAQPPVAPAAAPPPPS